MKFKFLPASYWVVPGNIQPEDSVEDVSNRIHKSITFSESNVKIRNNAFTNKGGDIVKYDGVITQNKKLKTIHQALTPAIILAQCFSLFPVCGVTSPTADSLRFKWKSFRIVYSLISIFGGIAIFITLFIRLFTIGISIGNCVSLFFVGTAITICVMFVYLARKYPDVAKRWALIETQLPPGPRIEHQIKKLTVLVMLCATGEHLLSALRDVMFAMKCAPKPDQVMKTFLIQTFPHVYQFLPYNLLSIWIGVIAKIHNAMLTFSWNYLDLFIIVISVGIAESFKEYNKKLERVKYQAMPDRFWLRLREEYVLFSELITTVDEMLSPIMMLSFTNNLFFICTQLLNALSDGFTNIQQAVYFWYSFMFLVFRTLSVLIYASSINEESKEPLRILRAVPHQCYSMEVQRFTSLVTDSQLALTGMKFFKITRSIMLTIMGTIVTYELVLVQFNAKEEKPGQICMKIT